MYGREVNFRNWGLGIVIAQKYRIWRLQLNKGTAVQARCSLDARLGTAYRTHLPHSPARTAASDRLHNETA